MSENSAGVRMGARGWGLVLAVVAAVAIGAFYLLKTPAPPDEQTATAVPRSPDSAPGVATTSTADSETATTGNSATPTVDLPQGASDTSGETLAVPEFDVVRVDPDGNAVIAGSAAPGSRVVILMDDIEIEAPEVNADGEFVGLLTLPLSDAPRVLTLRAERDGLSELSSDQVILAPTPPASSPARSAPVDDVLNTAEARAAPDAIPENAQQARVAPDASQAQAANASTEEVRDTDPEAERSQQAQPDATAATDQLAAAAPVEPQVPGEAEVKADPVPVTVLRAGKDGVEVLQPAEPGDAAAQVTLDTISYSAEGAVLLRGTAKFGAVVRVYLDNRPVTDIDTNAKGRFRGEIGAVEPGVYTLRLDEVDAAGQVLSRFETPFKREAPEILEPVNDPAEEDESPVRAVTVQTGDTLWAISRDRYGDGVLYVKVVEANRDSIKNPDLIYPGQVFTIPE